MLSPFLQRQLCWLGLHLAFQEPLPCPMGQCVIREYLRILHTNRDLPTSSQKVRRKPTGFPIPPVSGTLATLLPGSALPPGHLVVSDGLCDPPSTSLQSDPREKACDPGRGQAPNLGKGRPAPLLRPCSLSPSHCVAVTVTLSPFLP